MTEKEESPKIEPVDVPEIEAGEEGEPGVSIPPREEVEKREEPSAGPQHPAGDPLELDPISVPERVESAWPKVLAWLAGNRVRAAGLLAALLVLAVVLIFGLMSRGEREGGKRGSLGEVVTASLGGEHYVRFGLWGPFDDYEERARLRRALPKIKHELILSGGQPEMARSIEEVDLKFIRSHILAIVSRSTGIPVEELDLRGLSLTRYSDAADPGGDKRW